MKSLFLLALPRSLSSWVYQACLAATGLRQPAWTSDGEILNLDRHVFAGGEGARHFLTPEGPGADFARGRAFLEALAAPSGFAYKDVTQPFIAADWAAANGDACNVVYLARPLADIADAMWRRGWSYPAKAVTPRDLGLGDFLRGLLAAEAALARLEIPVLYFDELIRDRSPLEELLRTWYPGSAPLPAPDLFFLRKRDATLRRRDAPEYRELAARLEALASAPAA